MIILPNIQAEGIGIGIRYGCLVSHGRQRNIYLMILFPKMLWRQEIIVFTYLNENYTHKEINDIIKSILKVENYF